MRIDRLLGENPKFTNSFFNEPVSTEVICPQKKFILTLIRSGNMYVVEEEVFRLCFNRIMIEETGPGQTLYDYMVDLNRSPMTYKHKFIKTIEFQSYVGWKNMTARYSLNYLLDDLFDFATSGFCRPE